MPNVGAATGIKDSDDGNLTGAGTFSTTPNKPVGAGGTVLESFSATDLNLAQSFQPSASVPDVRNPVQEINLFVGEMARQLGCAPGAAIVRILDILNAMRFQYMS